MDDIRYFKLHNTGGFVAKILIIYGGNEGSDNNGNVIKFTEGVWQSKGYDDICASSERTVDLKDTGIPQGAKVQLKAYVCGGKDKTSNETFIYREKSNTMRKYKISGTTLFNTLSTE